MSLSEGGVCGAGARYPQSGGGEGATSGLSFSSYTVCGTVYMYVYMGGAICAKSGNIKNNSKRGSEGGGREKVNVGNTGSFELNRAPFYRNSCTYLPFSINKEYFSFLCRLESNKASYRSFWLKDMSYETMGLYSLEKI